MPSNQPRVLRSGLLLVLAGSLSAQGPGLSPYGSGGCGGGYVPTFHTGGEPPVLGNTAFQVVSENLIGFAPGLLFLSARSAALSILGMPLYVDPPFGFGLACQAGGPAGQGSGVVRFPLPIPAGAPLIGSSFYVQGFFLDPSLSPLLVHTHGLRITLRGSVRPEVAVCRDRLSYQAWFAGVTAAKADQMGRAIWAAHQVALFSYVKTERFSCGGESHWIVIVQHALSRMEFCLIPGGSFQMGDINRTGGGSELPVHWVRIQPFLMARTEVTQGIYPSTENPPWQGSPWVMTAPDNPASCLNWAHCTYFCAINYLRLPTEAEWEYACRGGTRTCFHIGENHPPSVALGDYAWYEANAWSASPPEPYPHKVGQKRPNAFGLFDMHGNVWEWCEDTGHSSDYKCAPVDGSAWLKGSQDKVIRGGSCLNSASYCRSAYRLRFPQIGSHGDLGFRPALSLP